MECVCVVCGARESKFRCTRCKERYYCGKECQAKDWKDHKRTCRKGVDGDSEEMEERIDGEEVQVHKHAQANSSPAFEGHDKDSAARRKTCAALGIRNEEQQSSDEEDYWECTMCLQPIVSNILQCKNGHLMCGECYSMSKEACPTCGSPMDGTRNRALEKLRDRLRNKNVKEERSNLDVDKTQKKIAEEERAAAEMMEKKAEEERAAAEMMEKKAEEERAAAEMMEKKAEEERIAAAAAAAAAVARRRAEQERAIAAAAAAAAAAGKKRAEEERVAAERAAAEREAAEKKARKEKEAKKNKESAAARVEEQERQRGASQAEKKKKKSKKKGKGVGGEDRPEGLTWSGWTWFRNFLAVAVGVLVLVLLVRVFVGTLGGAANLVSEALHKKKQGHENDAAKAGNDALNEKKLLLEEASRRAVIMFDNEERSLASCSGYFKAGKYPEALKCFLKARQAAVKLHGKSAVIVGFIELHLAKIYHNNHNYFDARRHYTEALQIAQISSGKMSKNTGDCLFGIGGTYFYEGVYDKALQAFEEAIEVFEEVRGLENDEGFTLLHFLATCYFHVGRADDGRYAYEQSLGDVREKKYGDSIQFAEDHFSFALAPTTDGEMREAQLTLQLHSAKEGMRIVKKLGRSEYYPRFSHLLMRLEQRRDKDRSEAKVKGSTTSHRGNAHRGQNFEKTGPDSVLMGLRDKWRALLSRRKPTEALEVLDEASRFIEKTGSLTNGVTVDALSELGSLYDIKYGMHVEAMHACQRAVRLIPLIAGDKNTKKVANVHECVVRNMVKRDWEVEDAERWYNLEEASESAREVVRIYKKLGIAMEEGMFSEGALEFFEEIRGESDSVIRRTWFYHHSLLGLDADEDEEEMYKEAPLDDELRDDELDNDEDEELDDELGEGEGELDDELLPDDDELARGRCPRLVVTRPRMT